MSPAAASLAALYAFDAVSGVPGMQLSASLVLFAFVSGDEVCSVVRPLVNAVPLLMLLSRSVASCRQLVGNPPKKVEFWSSPGGKISIKEGIDDFGRGLLKVCPGTVEGGW